MSSVINEKAREQQELRRIAGSASLPSPEEVRRVLLILAKDCDRTSQNYARVIASRMMVSPWYIQGV